MALQRNGLRLGVNPSSQDLDNLSFDPVGLLRVTEIGGTPDGTNFYLAQVDSTGALKVTSTGGGSDTVGIYKATPGTLADNTSTQLLTDNYGQAKVVVMGTPSDGATGSAVPADATLVGLKNTANNLAALRGENDNADGVTPIASGDLLGVVSRGTVFNGSSWDRMKQPTTPADTQPVSGTITSNQGTGGSSAWKVKDDYQAGEILADQSGAGAVLTFTFSNAVDFIWVTDTGSTTTNISRVDPFGGTPSASLGIPVFNQAPSPISVTPAATVIKVYAPSGANISMYGYRRT